MTATILNFPAKPKSPEECIEFLALGIIKSAHVFMEMGMIIEADNMGKAAFYLNKVAKSLRSDDEFQS